MSGETISLRSDCPREWTTTVTMLYCGRSYSRGAQGILLVYDITNKWSFEGMDRWVAEVEEHAPGIPKVEQQRQQQQQSVACSAGTGREQAAPRIQTTG